MAQGKDDSDLLELAPDVLIALADVVTLIGIKRLDRIFGVLGGELAALSELLQKPSSPSQEDRFRRRVRKLLREIERACTWQRRQQPRHQESCERLRLLRNLVGSPQLLIQTKARLEQGLVAYADDGRLPKLIAFLKGFSSGQRDPTTVLASTSAHNVSRSGKIGHQSEYPKHVGQQLYLTLRKYSNCECVAHPGVCASGVSHRHFSRLRLLPARDIDNRGFVCFDMFFSSRPASLEQQKRVDWRDIQFRVLSKKMGMKKARFLAQDNESDSLDQQTKPIIEADFCRHLETQYGSKICVWVHGEQLSLLEDCMPIERNILGCPSISLSTTLRIRYLSNKMKVILAYIVARSVWEFYDSDWMARRWHAEDIHFMQESPQDTESEPLIFINKPYLSVQFEEAGSLVNECTSVGQIHRYPRILSLGIMLIEIGTGKTTTTLFPNHNININSDWSSARGFLTKVDPCDDFDYRSYWDAARSCVNDPFLLRATSFESNGTLPMDIDGRRNMIFENVVLPLEDLLRGTGWIHDLWTVGPTKPVPTLNSLPVQAIQKAKPVTSLPADTTSQDISVPLSTPFRPLDRRGFEIALICALTLEANAVISLFDHHWDEHGDKYGKSPRDPNAYTTGRMGSHNVVVVHMPNLGKVCAAIVAAGLRTSFPNIKLVMVIGICGAVPYDQYHQKDVYLGDVVISQSLIQYDLGSLYPMAFEAKGTLEGGLGKLPPEVRSMLAKMGTEYHRGRLQNGAYALLKELRQNRSWAKYPGPEADKLFEPTFLHQHRDAKGCRICCAKDGTHICNDAISAKCEDLGCDKRGLTRLERARESHQKNESASGNVFLPSIHIGRMGSGDTVMKSGLHRDEVAKRHGIIAFEMEGAGVWDYFPSLVVKGVCDYADSHKNKRWQHYAAKALLKDWTVETELANAGDV